MCFLKFAFDNKRHENDNYNREELIACTAKIFGDTVSRRELKKRARLWYAADHLINADLLDKLSRSPYIEVRETAVLNPNLPLSKIHELLNDDHEVVRNAAKLRLQSN